MEPVVVHVRPRPTKETGKKREGGVGMREWRGTVEHSGQSLGGLSRQPNTVTHADFGVELGDVKEFQELPRPEGLEIGYCLLFARGWGKQTEVWPLLETVLCFYAEG